mgnify:CR=1 FL=1|tara:strand:- start:4914 stop:5273 length:360 start_codon:yes stop_codon:yes gene_type:complete
MKVNQKKIHKPWGHEVIWAQCEKFVGKILYLKSGHRLSRQFHLKKEETVIVSKGTLHLEVGDPEKYIEIFQIKEGQSFHVKPGVVHRFCAPNGDVELYEVSTPELEDVVRIEDDYSRTK